MRYFHNDYEDEIGTSINVYAETADELQDTAEEIEYALSDFQARVEPERFAGEGEYTVFITGTTMYSANEYGEAEDRMESIAQRWAI